MTTSRRSFLKASAFASLGGALGAASTAHAADEATLKLPSKWDAETEVLVAGSGIAGMSAAISAMDKNAKVLVLEKGKNYGGCAIINGGIIALGGGTRTQKEHGVEDSPELLYKKLTNPLHHEYRKNTPELIAKYSTWCPETQVWLENHGVRSFRHSQNPVSTILSIMSLITTFGGATAVTAEESLSRAAVS